MIQKKAISLRRWLPALLIVSLSAVNLMLIGQNFKLRALLASRGNGIDVTANSLKAGDVVANVSTSDLSGHPYELRYNDGKKLLLFFLSPHCPFCVHQAPLWRSVLNKIDTTRFDVVGVVGSREDHQAVSAHLEEFGYSKTKTTLPIVVFDDASLARYKLVGTPTTLLIDDKGKVEHAWIGMWNEDVTNEVAAVLK